MTMKLPVEVGIPQLLGKAGMMGATELTKAVGYCDLIAFYFILRVEEHTVKSNMKDFNQIKQFNLADMTFFYWDKKSKLCQFL